MSASFSDSVGCLEKLGTILYGAGPGDEDYFITADFYSIQREDCVLWAEFTRSQLIRPGDRHDPVYSGKVQKFIALYLPAIPYSADNCPLYPLR
jgi:hypothetical protein